MEELKVLIVDDSSLARSIISQILSEDSSVNVIGEADNGRSAVELAKQLKPNLITMDLHMPDMNCIEAIRQIMHCCPTPILVVTSKADAEAGFQAVSAGALEVFDKADIASTDYKSLLYKVRFLAKVKVIRHLQPKRLVNQANVLFPKSHPISYVGIASSTGGPKALSILLSSLPQSFRPPIIIAQHIGRQFDVGLVSFLAGTTKKAVVLARDNELIKPGYVYVAPADAHIAVRNNRFVSISKTINDVYIPSANTLFSSLAQQYRDRLAVVVLTGMGQDGADGAFEVAHNGGVVIAQDERSSTVFGMPKAVIDRKIAHKILGLEEIGLALVALTDHKETR